MLEAWDRLGDWSQQWLSLLYLTRLLLRIGAAAEVVTLHYALVAAAKPAPLDADRLAALAEALGRGAFDAAARRGSDMDGPAVVAFVRSSLRGHIAAVNRRLKQPGRGQTCRDRQDDPAPAPRERRGHDRADQHRQPGREIGQRYTPGEPGPDHRRERRRYRVVEQPPRRGRQPRRPAAG